MGVHSGIVWTPSFQRRDLKMYCCKVKSHYFSKFGKYLLKLIKNSSADDPISLHQFGQVHVCWYPMNIPIKTHSISSKTDQDTDQET